VPSVYNGRIIAKGKLDFRYNGLGWNAAQLEVAIIITATFRPGHIRPKRSSDSSNRRVVSNYSVYYTRAAEKTEPLQLLLPQRANAGSVRRVLPSIASAQLYPVWQALRRAAAGSIGCLRL